MDFHERVRHEYLRLADAEPERFVVIDAVGTVDEVFSEIRGVLVERFEGGSVTIDEASDSVPVPAQDTPASSSSEVPAASEAPAESEATAESEAADSPEKPRQKNADKGSARKPATMVGALGESQGALWDE